MRNKLFMLDDHLTAVECEVDKVESAGMFLCGLLDSLEGLDYRGVTTIPLHEMLVKTRGIYHLLLEGERKLSKRLKQASIVLDELKEAEKKA